MPTGPPPAISTGTRLGQLSKDVVCTLFVPVYLWLRAQLYFNLVAGATKLTLGFSLSYSDMQCKVPAWMALYPIL
jgi:hypothetical protein